jgi:predicted lipid-binding transport protein (Tim44 family)
MTQLFDPLNMILLAVALIVIWRLRSVLGQRTGAERPPIDPYASTRKTAPEAANGNVLNFPGEAKQIAPSKNDEPATPEWTGFASEGSSVAKGLEAIAAADPGFSTRSFVEGAKIAYELIVEAFAKGDKTALKPLLSKEVYDGFAEVIDERARKGEKIDAQFVGFEKAEIAGASLMAKRAGMTMRFVSQMISTTLDKDNRIVDGDPKEIRQITDVWAFERDVSSRDPNWKLVATEQPA